MIFGPDKINGISGDPRYDTTINLTYAVLIIICFILSAILNPILLWFHCSMTPSIPSLLFRLLNITDFITTTALCPFLVYGLLTPELVPHNVPATPAQLLFSALFGFLLFLSVSITTLMTATRVYAIKYPLQIMTKKKAIFYPMVGIVSAACFVVGLNFSKNKTWDRYLFSTNRLKVIILKPGTNQLENWPELVYTAVLMPIAIAGCVCAVITGREVYKAIEQMKQIQCIQVRNTKNQQHRSYITVLMLSGGIQVALIFVFAQFIYSITVVKSGFTYNAYYFMFGNALFCSLILSVINPMITITRCSGLKRFYIEKLNPQHQAASQALDSNPGENTFLMNIMSKKLRQPRFEKSLVYENDA